MNDRDHSQKKTLPRLDIKTKTNYSPHVVILGAGASHACCPNGDKNGLKIPLMNDFVETIKIEEIIKKSGHDPSGNFERIYSELYRSGNQQAIDELGIAIEEYFGGIVLQEEPTLYDYLVLSLRPKDLIVTFNWDPLLPQAYKRWRHLGRILPELAFLHGNIDVGVNVEKRQSAFLSDQPKFTPTPLLYPVENKDYNSDPFIASEWAKATASLSEAYYVTIIGYSAPVTDVEARSLLLNAWKNNTTRTLAQFNIIDIRPSDEVETSWSDFLDGVHGGASPDTLNSYLMFHPRRTCEAFALATLQQDPWQEDRFPKDPTLQELEAWVRPLIDEESTGILSAKPHHAQPG